MHSSIYEELQQRRFRAYGVRVREFIKDKIELVVMAFMSFAVWSVFLWPAIVFAMGHHVVISVK